MNWFPVIYPVNNLGPILRDLVWEQHQKTKAPVELIAPLALGRAALVRQNSVDVCRPNCGPLPPSLRVVVIARTNEGKSSVLDGLADPIFAFEAKQEKENAAKFMQFEAEYKTWDIQQKIFLAAIEKAMKKEGSTESLSARRPATPMLPRHCAIPVAPECHIAGTPHESVQRIASCCGKVSSRGRASVRTIE